MSLDQLVKSKIELVDMALTKAGAQRILENKLFRENRVRSFDDYAEYSVERDGAVPLNLIISIDALQVDIDGMAEVFEWSNQQIDDERDNIIAILQLIFVSAVEITRCGAHYRNIRFLDSQGICIKTCKYISGIYFPFFCKTEKYRPIVSNEG